MSVSLIGRIGLALLPFLLVWGCGVPALAKGADDAEEQPASHGDPASHEEAAHEEAAHDADAHGGGHAGAGHHVDPGHGNATAAMENPAEFRTDLAIYTLIVFLLLLVILGKFAWPVISDALVEREQRIADHIESAENKHEEAKGLLSQYEAKLEAAADEVRELLEEARRDAEATKAQILSEAKSAAEAEHARALRDVEQATDAALKQIAEKSAHFVVGMTGQIVQEELSEKQQQRIVRDALTKLTNSG